MILYILIRYIIIIHESIIIINSKIVIVFAGYIFLHFLEIMHKQTVFYRCRKMLPTKVYGKG